MLLLLNYTDEKKIDRGTGLEKEETEVVATNLALSNEMNTKQI